jgi:hypothetical protein
MNTPGDIEHNGVILQNVIDLQAKDALFNEMYQAIKEYRLYVVPSIRYEDDFIVARNRLRQVMECARKIMEAGK